MSVRDLLQFLLRGLMKREAIKPGYLTIARKLAPVYRLSSIWLTYYSGIVSRVLIELLGSLYSVLYRNITEATSIRYTATGKLLLYSGERYGLLFLDQTAYLSLAS